MLIPYGVVAVLQIIQDKLVYRQKHCLYFVLFIFLVFIYLFFLIYIFSFFIVHSIKFFTFSFQKYRVRSLKNISLLSEILCTIF